MEDAPNDPATESGEGRLLALAQELGNVSEACRRLGVDRSRYYRVLARTRAGDLWPRRSPLAKSVALKTRLVGLCLKYPEWGCDRLALYLTLTGDPVSSPTVQKVLIRHGLGRVRQRREAVHRLTEEEKEASPTKAPPSRDGGAQGAELKSAH